MPFGARASRDFLPVSCCGDVLHNNSTCNLYSRLPLLHVLSRPPHNLDSLTSRRGRVEPVLTLWCFATLAGGRYRFRFTDGHWHAGLVVALHAAPQQAGHQDFIYSHSTMPTKSVDCVAVLQDVIILVRTPAGLEIRAAPKCLGACVVPPLSKFVQMPAIPYRSNHLCCCSQINAQAMCSAAANASARHHPAPFNFEDHSCRASRRRRCASCTPCSRSSWAACSCPSPRCSAAPSAPTTSPGHTPLLRRCCHDFIARCAGEPPSGPALRSAAWRSS